MSFHMNALAADVSITKVEDMIRVLAGTVVAKAQTRRLHPTYGVTKAIVREAGVRLDAAINIYGVLTDQAMHVHAVAKLIELPAGDTTDLVEQARAALADL